MHYQGLACILPAARHRLLASHSEQGVVTLRLGMLPRSRSWRRPWLRHGVALAAGAGRGAARQVHGCAAGLVLLLLLALLALLAAGWTCCLGVGAEGRACPCPMPRLRQQQAGSREASTQPALPAKEILKFASDHSSQQARPPQPAACARKRLAAGLLPAQALLL